MHTGITITLLLKMGEGFTGINIHSLYVHYIHCCWIFEILHNNIFWWTQKWLGDKVKIENVNDSFKSLGWEEQERTVGGWSEERMRLRRLSLVSCCCEQLDRFKEPSKEEREQRTCGPATLGGLGGRIYIHIYTHTHTHIYITNKLIIRLAQETLCF